MNVLTTKSLTKEWRSNNSEKPDERVNLDEEKIKEVKEKWRHRFEKEFEEKRFPRHPYKIMQEIRKETGNYSYSLESPEFYQGLNELKEEYTDRYRKLKKRYNS